MKKFKFALDGYLKVRKIEERKKMTELAEVLNEVNIYRNQQAEYKSKSHELLLAQHKMLGEGKLDPTFQYRANAYISALRKRSELAEEKIAGMSEELEKRQAALLEARKNRRVIEILKEKKAEEYKYQVSKLSVTEMDEFNQKIVSGVFAESKNNSDEGDSKKVW